MADDGGLGQLALQLSQELGHQVKVARGLPRASDERLGFTTRPSKGNWLYVKVGTPFIGNVLNPSFGSGYDPANYGSPNREALRDAIAMILTGQGLTDYGQTPVPLIPFA